MRTLHVGLTGGIGAGKSTVARLLAGHGAIVLDADLAARAVVEPGTEGLAEVVGAFGPRVLREDGSLDRAALASVVFSDEERRKRLNAIVHPRVRAWMAERAAAAPEGSVVVQDIPLLVEGGLTPLFDVVVVVDADDDIRVGRLIRDRAMTEPEARARIAAQAPREQRNAAADRLIDNSGGTEELNEAVADLWHELEGKSKQS
ncbi:dephospho-CoA kinase [Actinospica sp. MGRD01-02]|uniref:Dephospho-CoA kinase n=1 Tax=Actinospica acidithermotolerans TaxID=2828514 RepID=A0A941IFL9_9ACTN|nr:dephospho-CoA kinase [Actinospica acidithermotolerans]MBR7825194.1 dephospho-CoA kinase [Actinospica acidithermotolerans]